jgi:DNA-binding transcriptional LysR family regulator
MEPTPLARTLADAIQAVIKIYHGRLQHASRFEPLTSTRAFRIYNSDLGHLITLPRLFEWANKHAPNVRFVAVPLDKTPLIDRLESGEVDFAVGGFPSLRPLPRFRRR